MRAGIIRFSAAMMFFLSAAVSTVKASTLIDFEQFSDGEVLTNQLSGLTFTNATVLSAGISLNEFDFPPHSGENVVADIGGPVTILFAAPVSEVDAYFTYTVPLTLEAFGSGNLEIDSVTSAFSSNLASGPNPANEHLTLTAAQGITSVEFLGDPAGSSFTFDDLSYTYAVAVGSNCPEPSYVAVAGLVLIGLARIRRRLSVVS